MPVAAFVRQKKGRHPLGVDRPRCPEHFQNIRSQHDRTRADLHPVISGIPNSLTLQVVIFLKEGTGV